MVVGQDGNNYLAEVADFPQYGTGVGGWRDRLVVATTARARESGQEGFYSWLLAYSQAEVPPAELKGELPAPLFGV